MSIVLMNIVLCLKPRSILAPLSTTDFVCNLPMTTATIAIADQFGKSFHLIGYQSMTDLHSQ